MNQVRMSQMIASARRNIERNRKTAEELKAQDIPDQKNVCEWCEGTGEVATDEDDGEGHTMRGVGTKKCICQYDV